MLLNDPTYVEAARSLAVKVIKEGGADTNTRVDYAFRRVLTRSPSADEAKVLADLYQQHLTQFTAEKGAADKLLTVGETKPAAEAESAEVAAWMSVCRVLLNLHETITRN